MTNEAGYSEEAVDPRLVAETLARVSNRPPPKNPASAGCGAAIIFGVALATLPFVARFIPLSGGWLIAIGIGLGVVVLVGALLSVFGGGFVAGAVGSDVEEAVEELLAAFPDGDPATLRRAAVRILDQSTVSTGPTTVETFDRSEVAERLGDALPYVIRVERILLERDEIYPCFTLDSG